MPVKGSSKLSETFLAALASGNCAGTAEALNAGCQCVSLDRQALVGALARDPRDGALQAMLAESRPHLFADSMAFVSARHVKRMADVVAAIEDVVALPAWQDTVLAWAPESARRPAKAAGVFLGYDFHLGADGPQLIEINTNAGGGLLNAILGRAQRACCNEVAEAMEAMQGSDAADLEARFVEMFRAEWRAERGEVVLRSIAIVDEAPQEQYLLPEFLLFQRLFERHGITAWICDPAELVHTGAGLTLHGQPVDLVYNRLTDFALEAPASRALREAWFAGSAVITPHPRAHALYADKRNLVLLSDPARLRSLGVGEGSIATVVAGVPRTEAVVREQADDFWARRRRLFFKPASGFGSRGAYRGDKLTKRVFEEILAGDYIAQALVPPTERRLEVEGATVDLKMDLRNYVYRGEVQLVTARLYRGQTTNFRTPGGGFAPVLAVPCEHGEEGAGA
ncbi:hypothetical protein [Zoogloea sp.]|uniref:hypothetical protein n=1 Tax=Zoogloea sp. TaxID=49181 RepID=UPI002614C451|nr:hypothetical protein [Zoogloea sp.]